MNCPAKGKKSDRLPRLANRWRAPATAALLYGILGHAALAQIAAGTAATETTERKIQQLTDAVEQAQAQMSAYQKQLQDLQQQLAALRQQLAAEKNTEGASAASQTAEAADGDPPGTSKSSLAEIRERQGVDESQIATLDQTKVETESKFPLKVSGLLLFNGYVNTRQVDAAADPTYALPGGGSTGFSLRQTVLGLDARGPRVFGAASHADVRVDFFANGSQSGYAPGGLLRLRTAHATLNWHDTEAFVELDRSLLSPNAPSSLLAVAQPEFAWSGNLWTWNPQIGASQQIQLTETKRLKLEAALIDVADPQFPGAPPNASTVSLGERSRWPGTEARIAFAAGSQTTGSEIGVGGYFSPHKTEDNVRFDAWAGTVDMRLPLGRHFEMTANAYRGLALGGLGGGGYVDYLSWYVGATEITRPLDDVGGWTQVKSKVGERFELNAGYGIDNPFAGEIRGATAPLHPTSYPGLARNRATFGNVIYKPNAYLLFSLEYRRLWTNSITGPTNLSDVIGLGAGYRF